MKQKNLVMYDGLYMPIALMIALLSGIALIPLVSFGHYEWIVPLTVIPFLLLNIIDIVEVNFVKREYREGVIFFGYKTGKWKPIPPIKYVSIVSQSIKFTTSPGFDTIYGTIKIRLFQSYNVKVKLKEVNNIKRALKFGKLLDATIRPPSFVEL